MKINYTWPGRLHIMIQPRYWWITLWIMRRRFHYYWETTPG